MRSRRALATIGVAAAGVAAVVAGGVALQATALLPPASGSLASLRVPLALHHYRHVDSTIAIGEGARRRGSCTQRSFAETGRRRLGAVVRVEPGLTVVAVPPHTLAGHGGPAALRAVPPLVLIELAGCPRVLERQLRAAAAARRITASDDGRLLRFPEKGMRVTLTIDTRTGRPEAVAVASKGGGGTSVLRYGTDERRAG